MKALLVNGSPRKSECTHTALQIVGDSLREEGIEVDEFWVGNKPIPGCVGCRRCKELKHCLFDVDAVHDFLAIADDYDAYVFGAPVYYSGIPGHMKCFLDRVFYSNQGRVRFAFKPAAAITSARRAGTTATLEQLQKHIQHQQMVQVNSHYWPMVHGNSPDEVMRDEEGVQTMQVLGRNMAFVMKCIEAGVSAGVELPAPADPHLRTNFID